MLEMLAKFCEDMCEDSQMQMVTKCNMEIGVPLKDDRDAVSNECTVCQRYLEQVEAIKEVMDKYAGMM